MFTPISSYDVSKLLAEMPRDKATGLDNIQARLLKMASPAISDSLAYIFNMSLALGKFPDAWKNARVSAIYKKGPRVDPGNYRPISILPVVSKLLERIVHKQLYNYFSEHKLLAPQQSGFRPKHSTQTSLHNFTEFAFREIGQGNCVGLVSLDLRKAFDTVDHSILLDKLSYYGLRDISLAWFHSYLDNRQQVACVNGNLSEPRTITTGVPQGSILGPLLFIIYVNDIGACFEYASINLYADDTLFYFSGSSTAVVSQALSHDLANVSSWLRANKLSLHIGKTNSMVISSKRRAHASDLGLSLDGEQINQESSCTYLGITLDSKLTFIDQFDETFKKLNKALGIFSRAAKFIPQSACITLYNTLILPYIDYCSTVWSASLRKKDLVRLQKIQNRAMRIILKCPARTHITDMLDTLKWMSIKQRFHYNYCILIWKILNGKTPEYLSNQFTLASQSHNYNTRFASTGSIIHQSTTPKSLGFVAPTIWNAIPQHVRDAGSLYSFKKNILTHIFGSVERF